MPGFNTVPIVVINDVERGFYYQASALSLLLLALWLASPVLLAGRKPRGLIATAT
jgi:ABC-type Fe3+ transport system permease subunit